VSAGVKPFRFGIQTSSAADGAAWRARARQVEDLGYSSLYIPDHFGDQWGPLVALTVAAEATTSLRIGGLVFDNDYRHPVVLAKEIATLDLVSDGRVEFGIGAGWMKTDYEQSGIPYDAPGVRIRRLEEALAIFRSMWADGKATFSGSHYQVTDAEGSPPPIQRPHPPILIGGGGRRVLTLAAQQADIVGINPTLTEGFVGAGAAASATAPAYREKLNWVRQAAGDRFDQLELQCLTFFVQVVPNRDEVLANLAPLFGITPEEAGQVPLALVGTVDHICEQLQQRREELGLSYWILHEAEIESFAPVVARLTGT
jgi:probable F420-dependent oxidoreductase